MRVDADQLDAGHELQRGNSLGRGPGGDGEAELRILLPGPHELVGVRLDAGRHPRQHLRPVGSRRCGLQEGTQARHLVERVDDDPAHAVLQGRPQLVDRLVVAVEDQPRRGDARGESDMELPAGCDVEVHPLVLSQTGHGAAQESFGGVGDAVAPRRDRLPARMAQMLLVVHEEWRAELLRQLQEIEAADAEMPLPVDRGRAREEVALQGRRRDVVVSRHGGAG